jgi:two-component system nitrate/nitrite response regulator NarL
MKKKQQHNIKIFLIDDHPALRDGVRACLNDHGSFTVVGEAANDREALRELAKTAPDIILLDINLPDMDGGELARRIRQMFPMVKIIAFSIHSSQEYVVRMAHCGVHGYVMKDQPTAELIEAVKRVYAGGLYFPASMADAILSPSAESVPGDRLTAREKEVISLLAEGMSNKEVARKLGISIRTAETHREHLAHKLNIMTVAGLTKYAIQHGLTQLKGTDSGHMAKE